MRRCDDATTGGVKELILVKTSRFIPVLSFDQKKTLLSGSKMVNKVCVCVCVCVCVWDAITGIRAS